MKSAESDERVTTNAALARAAERLSRYFGGQLLVKLLYLFGIVFATRAAGPGGWGLLTAAIAAGFILVTAVNLGLNPYVTREIAARAVSVHRMTRATARYRLATSILFVLTMPMLLYLTIRGIDSLILIAVTIYLLADSWAKYLFALLRGAENTRFEILGANVEKALFMVLAGGALAVSALSDIAAVRWVGGAFAVSAAVKLLVALRGTALALDFVSIPARYFLASFSNVRLWIREFRYVKESADFLFMAFFSTLYFRIDTYMLAVMLGNEGAGYYGAAYKLIEGLLFAPESVLIVFMPMLVRALKNGDSLAGKLPNGHSQIVKEVSALQVAVAGPVAVGLMLESEWLVNLMYGASFHPSARILFWISPAFAFMSINFLAGGLLTASYMQRSLLVISAVAAVGNVALNLIAIPVYGVLGAVVATILTEAAVCIAMLVRLTRRVDAVLIWKPAAIAFGYMCVFVILPNWGLHDHLPFVGRLILGIASTGAFLSLLVYRQHIPRPWFTEVCP